MCNLIGVLTQFLLVLLGLHVLVAPGFAWEVGSAGLKYGQPIVGVLLILAGTGLRAALSPPYRHKLAGGWRADLATVRACAAAAPRPNIPQRPPVRAALILVFLPALLIYLSNGRTLGSGDTAPMLQTALSLARHGDLNLDEFVDPARPPYYVTRSGDHFYSRFSIGPAILALPLVKLSLLAGGDLDDPVPRARLEKTCAALLAALAAAVMFLILLRIVPLPAAGLLTVVFALGTQNWSTASQALWQHGPVLLLVAGALLAGQHAAARRRPWLAVIQGALLGLAVACRPTAVLALAAFAVLVAARRWRHLPAYLAGAALAYAPFAAAHAAIYGSWLGPYAHAAAAERWAADWRISVPGNLVSPARGLLVYQPLLVLAALAAIPALRPRLGPAAAPALGAWCLAHLLVVSSYTHWWGGHAWGPRFLTELTPALLLLAAPTIAALWRRRPGRALVLGLLAWSIGLQAFGVYSPAAQRWMKEPVDIDAAPQRLWDWSDPPFLPGRSTRWSSTASFWTCTAP